MRRPSVIVVILVISGCSHEHHPKTVAGVPSSTPAVARASKQQEQAPVPASPHLAVSDDLGRQCSLHLGDIAGAPKFAFDEFALLPEDRSILQQVATCLTNGPLKGRKLQLVGRADPRGTEEYNLGLGDRRAQTVGTYLVRLGLGTGQIVSTTRGALDASGRDDSTWQLDRRVDLQLN